MNTLTVEASTLTNEIPNNKIDHDKDPSHLSKRPIYHEDHSISLSKRYTLFPILDIQMYTQMKKQEIVLWTSNELDFSADKKDYDNLEPRLKRIIDYVNCFFSATDGQIVRNIAHRFLVETSTLEEQSFFIVQMYIELVHSETYSLIINTLVVDPDKRKELFTAADNLPCVRNKNLWIEEHINSDCSKSERLLAFACTEGIFFISSFLFIFYFRSKGILPNIIAANETISRDETIHRDTGILLHQREGLIDESRAHQIVKEAIDLELQFVDELLPESIEELSPESVKNYVKFLGDHLLASCGYKRIYNITADSLPTWIRDLSLNQKGNFYEVKIMNYVKTGLTKATDWQSRISGNSEKINMACLDPSEVDF